MTTEYDYFNIPAEMPVEPLHEKHILSALQIVRDAISTGADKAAEAKVGFAYNRKNYLEVGEIAPIDGNHNYYNSHRDDILVQVTVRINRGDKDDLFHKLEEKLIEEAAETRIAAAETALATIEAEEASLAARKAKLQADRAKIQADLKK